jgi:LysR family transcriptional regulator, glycine cleavage system transcriptional activator
MMKHLPHLAPLRTFEAAARLGGFTQAAQSLNITQGAASYQIKMLEERLGTKLFMREQHGLVLTPEGTQLLQSVVKALDILDLALWHLRMGRGRNTLAVTMFTSFAAKWLISRLSDLAAHYVDIGLQIFVEDHLVDFRAGDRDAGIRYGKGSWPGVDATLIHRDEIFPVCSPRLLSDRTLMDAASLLKFPLLCETDGSTFDDRADWHAWLRRAGHAVASDNGLGDLSYLLCGQACVVLQAAIEGQGIALARGLLVADDLAAGRLVPCCGPSLPSDSAYYFVRPAGKPAPPKVEAFKDWLLAAIAETRVSSSRYLKTILHDETQATLNSNPIAASDMIMNAAVGHG